MSRAAAQMTPREECLRPDARHNKERRERTDVPILQIEPTDD
jgi:hypothetical protein